MRKVAWFMLLVVGLVMASAIGVQAVYNSNSNQVEPDGFLMAIANKNGSNSYAYVSNSGEDSGHYKIKGSCAKNYNVNNDNSFTVDAPDSKNYSMYRGYNCNNSSDIVIAQIQTQNLSPNVAAYAQAQ